MVTLFIVLDRAGLTGARLNPDKLNKVCPNFGHFQIENQ
jgi:hypothetical protein